MCRSGETMSCCSCLFETRFMSASGNKKPENSAFKRRSEPAQDVLEKAEIFGSFSGIFLKFQRVSAVGF